LGRGRRAEGLTPLGGSPIPLGLRSAPAAAPLPHASVRAVPFSDGQVRVLRLERGFVEPDWCRRPHLGYVLSGELVLDLVDGSRLIIPAGEAFELTADPARAHKAAPAGEAVEILLVETT